MLLHIHKVLLRAYHSMQSTLPCHHGSRGALQQQWEGERKLHMGMKKKKKRKINERPRRIGMLALCFTCALFCQKMLLGTTFKTEIKIITR